MVVYILSEMRRRLPEFVARFVREGADAEPVIFGRYGRPEAVLLSCAAYEELCATVSGFAEAEVPGGGVGQGA